MPEPEPEPEDADTSADGSGVSPSSSSSGPTDGRLGGGDGIGSLVDGDGRGGVDGIGAGVSGDGVGVEVAGLSAGSVTDGSGPTLEGGDCDGDTLAPSGLTEGNPDDLGDGDASSARGGRGVTDESGVCGVPTAAFVTCTSGAASNSKMRAFDNE